jgi:hypothetical protein
MESNSLGAIHAVTVAELSTAFRETWADRIKEIIPNRVMINLERHLAAAYGQKARLA